MSYPNCLQALLILVWGNFVRQKQFLNGFWIAAIVPVIIAQPAWAQVTQITDVQIKPTSSGLDAILKTSDATMPKVFSTSYRNTFVANIVNTRLSLPKGNTFRVNTPAEGIASVTVTALGANSVRVTVIGTTAAPTAQVIPTPQGLLLSLSASATAQAQPAPVPTKPQNKPSTTRAASVETQAATEEPENEEEIEIVVTGEQEEGYQVPNATTGTRTDTPLRDIPQSIQVIPEQVLSDQKVIRLQDALRNVSGVREGNTSGNSGDAFIIRGFEQEAILRNGFRDNTSNSSFRDTANLERIEVLKGPASVLYGTLEPGGIINLNTKQPLSEPFYWVELEVGNRSYVRPNIDLSGPLNSDGTLLYRLNAAYESADDFRNFDQDIERFFISPVFTWKISDSLPFGNGFAERDSSASRTDLTLEFEYLDDERPFDRGLVAIGDEVADIPFDRILGEPDDFSAREQFRAEYRLEHRFSENWTLRNGFQFFLSDSKYAFTKDRFGTERGYW